MSAYSAPLKALVLMAGVQAFSWAVPPPPLPSPVQILSGLTRMEYTLAPGQCQTFRVSVIGGATAADRAVTWTLVGDGQIDFPQEDTVEYRAPRAGGGVTILTATCRRDANQSVSFVINVGPNPLAATPVPATVDLLPLLPHVPAERKQGRCANCYAWAATAALEMEMSVNYGIRERLSIQYFNEIYRPLGPTDPLDPCQPNPASLAFTLYARNEKLVPWSNANAGFQDADVTLPRVSRPAVGAYPHLLIHHLAVHQLATHLWSDEEIIAELKAQLHRKKAIVFKNDGHYVVIVGYNAQDSNPAHHQWTVLDTVGVTRDMPAGTFTMPMRSINYNYQDAPGVYKFTFEFVDLELVLDREGRPVRIEGPVPVTNPESSNPPASVPPSAPPSVPPSAPPSAPPRAPRQTPVTVDLNGDGRVDVLDLALLAKAYAATVGEFHYVEAADLNGDGRVGPDDASTFLAALDAQP